MAETSNTNTDCSDNGVARLHLSTGHVTLFDDYGHEQHYLDAHAAIDLLDLLSKHETRLRDAARAAEDRQLWDSAYQVARGLMAAGLRVYRIEPGFTSGPDFRSVVQVTVDTAQHVRDHAAGADVQTDERGGYTQTCAEVVPGVIITATEATRPRDVTAPSVAPAVTR